MYFAGLRGAIAFALSLHLEFKSKDKSKEDEKRHVLVTTTLIIVLFTIMFLGGATMPMMKVDTYISNIVDSFMYLFIYLKSFRIPQTLLNPFECALYA